MTDSEAGRSALLLWYRASGLSMKGVSFDDAVAHYADRYPSFLASFGWSAKRPSVTPGRLQSAMEDLGAQGFGKFPDQSAFFDVLISNLPTSLWKFNFEDVAQVAKETASDVAKTAAVGAGIYLAVLALGAVVVLSGSMKRSSA